MERGRGRANATHLAWPDERFAFAQGRVAEWFKAAVLKTAVGASPP
jgi:hypothetical protein